VPSTGSVRWHWDKRDDISARAQRAGGCPVCHPASWPSGPGCLGRVPGGRVFPKLSKPLNQRGRLGIPWLRRESRCCTGAFAGRTHAAGWWNPQFHVKKSSNGHPSFRLLQCLYFLVSPLGFHTSHPSQSAFISMVGLPLFPPSAKSFVLPKVLKLCS
jgi:hypothetical protein